MLKKNVIAFCLLATSFAHALPNSVTLRVNGPGAQAVDLEVLIMRHISQSSTIQTLCNVTCYGHQMDSRIPPLCHPGQTYQVSCNQTIDTSYSVPDHSVSASVEVSLIPNPELPVDKDVTVTLEAETVYVSSRDKDIGFIVGVESVRNAPRRGDPDFVHKVTLRPVDIAKLNNNLEPRNIRLSGSIMMFETGPATDFQVEESMSVSRNTLFHSYSWSSYDQTGFGFKAEPLAGGLLHKLDLSSAGVKMKKGGTYNFSLIRKFDKKTPQITNFYGTSSRLFSFKPLTSF